MDSKQREKKIGGREFRGTVPLRVNIIIVYVFHTRKQIFAIFLAVPLSGSVVLCSLAWCCLLVGVLTCVWRMPPNRFCYHVSVSAWGGGVSTGEAGREGSTTDLKGDLDFRPNSTNLYLLCTSVNV
jgi:hypothetical protein